MPFVVHSNVRPADIIVDIGKLVNEQSERTATSRRIAGR